MLGGYIAFWLLRLWGIDPFLSLPLVAVALELSGVWLVVSVQAAGSRSTNNNAANCILMCTGPAPCVMSTLLLYIPYTPGAALKSHRK